MRAPISTELTRADLFQRLWREPLSSVAADLGLSASGLAKLCDRTAIPYPTRGYWAKARAGRTGPAPDLPPAPEGASDQIRITPGQAVSRRAPVRLSPEVRREQLLEVAARVIVQDGLHALTIKRVARDAGLTAPRAYHFFSTVDDLMAELARRELQAIRTARAHRINTAERPAERLRLSTVTYLRQVAERGVLLQTLQNAPGVRRALRAEQRAIRADNTNVVATRFSDSHKVPSDVSRAATTALTSAVLRTGRILARGRLDLSLAETLAADIVEAGNRRLAARFETPPGSDVEDA